MTQNTKKLNPVYRFFCWCSGARLYILDKCPTDYNKFFGIGIVIFFTGIVAALSGGYAIYTVFNHLIVSIIFGVFWGMLIFFLDWYLVSSLKKQNKFHKELLMSFPRLVLAVLIAVVISKPLELKLFEKEINKVIENSKRENAVNYKDLVQQEFDEIEELQEANMVMNQQLLKKEEERDRLFNMTIEEAEGRSVTGKPGKGPVYEEKKAALNKTEDELQALKDRLLPMIRENNQRIATLKQKKDARLLKGENVNEKSDGFLARIMAFNKLTGTNRNIAVVGWFILLLFITIESAPILVKLISDRGPYDEMLEAEEYNKKFEVDRIVAKIQDEAQTLRFESEKQKMHFNAALENTREVMNNILLAKKEVEDKKVDKWKENQLKNIDKEMNDYSKFVNNIFNANFKELKNKDINKDWNAN